jgi:outer membrane receptor for ferrienterochelin and colicin/copper chaperone CopZ
MKIILSLFILLTTGLYYSAYAQSDSTATFEVAGNCAMCKKRIESAAQIDGVNTVSWDIKTHVLNVQYNPQKTKLAQIQQAIANAGHDTPLFRTTDELYEELHECCEYERLDAAPNDHNHEANEHDDHDDHDEHAEHDHHDHEHIVTGVVVNENTKGDLSPIIGEGPSRNDRTNENGVFKIKHEQGNRHLVFSYTGMQPDTIEVKDPHEVLVIHAQDNVLSEVVVSRRKKSNYIEALTPNRVEVLSARELFKAACCDLSESFETNVSVDVVASDAVTGSKQIQMLGLSGIYTQLTVENLPGPRGFATPLGLNSIAGTWIESIEISKGIGSVVNGFENMSGQINVELKKPQNTERLFFNAYANDMGRSDINLNLSQKINEDWSVGLLLHDNFMYNKNMNFSNNGFRDIPVGNLFSGVNRWNYENGKGTIVQFGIKYLKDDRTGGEIDFDKSNDYLTTNHYGLGFDNQRIEGFAKIGYVFPNNRLRSIGLQLSGSNYKQDSYFGQNTYLADQTSAYANLIFQDVISSVAHKYKVGISMSYDDYAEDIKIHRFDPDNTYRFDRNEVVSGAFAEYTFSPNDRFDAVLGLRQDYNSLYGWFTTPRAVLRYAPTGSTTLRLSSGRGQRTANIFAENLGIFASSRLIDLAAYTGGNVAYNLQPEVSWNTGFSVDQDFRLFGREAGVSVELFHNNFENQVVIDYEDPRKVAFYNLDGKSFSNSIQAEFRFMPAQHFEARMAYRLLDVETDYASGRFQKPLTAKHRGFANFAYFLHSGWHFDYTFNAVGKKRLPSTADNPAPYQLPEQSQAYVTMNAQITRTFGKNKNFDIYVGGENLTNYYQKDPILAFDEPFGSHFDTNLLWGPLTGRTFYTGIRYHIK